MKILITPDSFKNCLSATQVADAIERGIKKAMPDAITTKIPMADGGEGFVAAIIKACGGELEKVKVHDPLMREIESFYGRIGTTAIIEMAAASGIELLSEEELDPSKTTSYGTGELIKCALDVGCKKIIIGIGGSATNDGGVGMAQALGINFFNSEDNLIQEGKAGLSEIHRIDISSRHKKLNDCEIIAACDVDNPLTGENGASFVYGPQKGADEDMVEKLDKGLLNLANIISKDLGSEVKGIPGSGAAGGLGAGIIAFLNGRLQPGLQMVSEMTDLPTHIKNCDIIVTGEGKVDAQTYSGKTIGSLAKIASANNKPLVVVAGTVEPGAKKLYDLGVTAMFSIVNKPMTLNEALLEGAALLELETENIFRTIKTQS